MNRAVDTSIHTRLQAQEQLWLRDSWYEPFGMPENRDDRGVGWTKPSKCRVKTTDQGSAGRLL